MITSMTRSLIPDFSFNDATELAERLTWESGASVVADGDAMYVDLKTKTIYLPGVFIHDPELREAMIGGVCHESGHINWSPIPPKDATHLEFLSINLFEDIRIEEKMDKYFKARPKLDALYQWADQKNPGGYSVTNEDGSDELFQKMSVGLILLSRKYKTLAAFDTKLQTKLKDYQEFIGIPSSYNDVKTIALAFIQKIQADPDFARKTDNHKDERERNDKINKDIDVEREQAKQIRKVIKKLLEDTRLRRVKGTLKRLQEDLKDLQIPTTTGEEKKRGRLRERVEVFKDLVRNREIDLELPEFKANLKQTQKTIKKLENYFSKYVHTENFTDTLQIGIKKYIEEMEASYKSRINSEHDCTAHIPWTKKHDTTNEITKVDLECLVRWEVECEPYIRHLKSFLGKFLQVKLKERVIRGLPRGKLDRKRIYKMNKTRNIWKQTEYQTVKDTSVSIAIDQSGSMAGAPLETAARLGYILSKTMESFHISNEVISYAASDVDIRKREKRLIPAVFSRVNSRLVHNVLKSFTRKDSDSLSVLNYQLGTWVVHPGVINSQTGKTVNGYYDAQNIDNESIVEIARRLLHRREKRKILFVISDGQPVGPGCNSDVMVADLKVKVQELEKIGVEVIAFGIRTDYGKDIYPKYLELNQVDDLLQIGVDEFKSVLVPMRRQQVS